MSISNLAHEIHSFVSFCASARMISGRFPSVEVTSRFAQSVVGIRESNFPSDSSVGNRESMLQPLCDGDPVLDLLSVNHCSNWINNSNVCLTSPRYSVLMHVQGMTVAD